jgi:predicted site-specific integrase-resolvase
MSLKSQLYEGLPSSLLTQDDVCKILQVSRKWLQIQRRRGNLKYLRFGHRTIRIPVAEVERLAKEAEKP